MSERERGRERERVCVRVREGGKVEFNNKNNETFHSAIYYNSAHTPIFPRGFISER